MSVASLDDEKTAADDAPAPKRSSLYGEYRKVYPRSVSGAFRRLKWAAVIALLGIYYITPWIRWDRGPGAPDQAVLVDMPGRRLYFFFIELWPQQIYMLTGLLILGAVGLFLATALAGRIWCGYACPQTVWTDLFLWVERVFEGDRSERMRLDTAPWSAAKLARKAGKHAAWLLIAAATGGAWIFYFADAPTLALEILRFEASLNVMLFIALFTGLTYLLAGMAREQVCIYMCPWPRFQAAMQDEDSLIVTYEDWRGAPHARLKKGQSWEERAAEGFGDCIDCGACHQVCPTGVDIRKGQQLACIGCGLCVDACNDVMARNGRPTELVRFDTLNAQAERAAGRTPRFRLIRPRTIVYGLVLVVVAGALVAGLVFQPRLDVNVLRDRAPLFVAMSNGDVQNAYTLKILNMTRADRDYRVTFEGIEGAGLSIAGGAEEPADHLVLHAGPDAVATYRVLARVPAAALSEKSTPVAFILTPLPGGSPDRNATVFLGP